MSDLLVRVVKIDAIEPHPNADKLEIVRVGGWQIVSGKGNYQAGQTAVHIPPDAMVPKALADQWSVTQYLSWKKDAAKGRVKAVRLRGAPSFGFLAPNDTNAEVGINLAEALGIEKYEEPVPIGMQAGQMARNHPLFHTYTDIQNLRNYPQELDYSTLIITEKLHGTNSRVGWVRNFREDGTSELEMVVGTHRTQRKLEDPGVYGLPIVKYHESIDKIMDWTIANFTEQVNSFIIFGEIYGAGVQDLHYGAKNEKDYRVFDVAVNGQYVSWTMIEAWSEEFGLPLVPVLAQGRFNFEELCALAEGDSVLCPGQIKEGLVVRPWVENTWDCGKRMIFKVISPDYLTRKNGSEHH